MARRVQLARGSDTVRSRVLSLRHRFRAEAAPGVVGQWELTVGEQVFTISVADGRCAVRDGPALDPDTRLATDPKTWAEIDDGALWGLDAFLDRRVSVRGNLDLGVRIQTLFRPRGRVRRPHELEQLDIVADDVRLSTYVCGRGSPVVLLHGLGGSKISLLPLVPALAARHQVIVPDLPGHGESELPRADYSPRYYARVIRKLMDSMGLEQAAVLGNSLGGRIALELGVRSPDRVFGLVLLGPAVPGFRVRYLLGFTRVIPSEWSGIPFPLREQWMRLAIRRLFVDPGVLPEEAYAAAAEEFIRVYQAPAARVAFFDSLRHILTEPPKPFWARMRRVRVPSLVVWGEGDKMVPPRLASKLAEALPRSELRLLPEVGHVPQFEAPDVTSAAVAGFLDELDAEAPAV